VTALEAVAESWPSVVLWGLAATAAMSTALEGAQLLGYSRMSLPFLFGAFVSDSRRSAVIFGYALYLVGGWLFAFAYALAFASLGTAAWWAGLLLGVLHGGFLITVFLPLLPYVHPRLATDYDGPSALRRLEPPGPFGLNYGRATPLTTVAAQALYGLVFALGFHLP
jgi:hypothetical protein